jgi:hypothetical protein
MSEPAWAPVDACTLPAVERPLREAEFDAPFATALVGVARPEPERLRSTFDRDAETEDLVLGGRVPAVRVAVLDGIARRAAAAGAETGTAPSA